MKMNYINMTFLLNQYVHLILNILIHFKSSELRSVRNEKFDVNACNDSNFISLSINI